MPVRESVLSAPSLSRVTQGEAPTVTESYRQSLTLSIQCHGWEEKFWSLSTWVQVSAPPLVSCAALGNRSQESKSGPRSDNRPRLCYEGEVSECV